MFSVPTVRSFATEISQECVVFNQSVEIYDIFQWEDYSQHHKQTILNIMIVISDIVNKNINSLFIYIAMKSSQGGDVMIEHSQVYEWPPLPQAGHPRLPV